MEGTTFPRDVEWAGVELRYFLAAFIPEVPRETGAQFRPVEPAIAGDVAIAYRGTEVPPGQSAAREYRGYIGPKRLERLEPFGVGLESSINVGWAWMQPLTRFFSWLLQLCYAVVPNYGVAIILLTILVRLVTAPLTQKQMRSMKGMSALQPKIKELQEKYADDRQRQSQEMMKLYKETGVNPLGGCLPLVLQFPVFIGLYYALQSSIDLRQAPFVAWIQDLSIPEELFMIPGLDIPVRVLPLIMGLSMILQQRMTPSTMDPAQARMMMTVMPVMFTVLFYQFPSGLVLYWMVSNLLAIAHQVWVNRK
jgi:YidC/Oxa1 family membrane protein insertase